MVGAWFPGPTEQHLVCGCSTHSPPWDSRTSRVLRGGRCPTSHTRVLCLSLGVGLGREELGTVWAAPPEPRASLGPIRGEDPGRGNHNSQGHSQQQAGDATVGGSREGRGQDPAAPASPALLLSVIRFPLPAYSPPPPSPALKPQISARQRLEIVEIKSARACGRAQGAVPGMGCGCDGGVEGPAFRGLCTALPTPAAVAVRAPSGGGGVRRAAGRADADSERTFCSRKRR